MLLIFTAIARILLLQWVCSSALIHEVPSLGESRFSILLHRQRVPVLGDGETISYKSVYFGSVSVGAPDKQDFAMVFDTGSGHIIIPSSTCTVETCKIHQQYDRTLSMTAIDVDYDGTHVKAGGPRDQITVAFGTGEVTGQFVDDRLCLGNRTPVDKSVSQNISLLLQTASVEEVRTAMKLPPGCVDLRIVTATEMTHEPFHAFSFDGVMGLGLDTLALAPEFSFFGMMVSQGRVKMPTFGVFLAEHEEEQSEISFGGFAPERIKSGLSWTDVAFPELGYWQVHIKKLRIGNKSMDFCDDGQCRAVVDTGTSLLAVPSGFADTLQQELQQSIEDPPDIGNADLAADAHCKDAKGAVLYFELDGAMLELEPGDYARPTMAAEEEQLLQQEEADSENSSSNEKPTIESGKSEGQEDVASAGASCRPTLMAIDLPEPLGPKLFIMGEPVLRKYYTAYDWSEKKVGFALAVHEQDSKAKEAEREKQKQQDKEKSKETQEASAAPIKPRRKILL